MSVPDVQGFSSSSGGAVQRDMSISSTSLDESLAKLPGLPLPFTFYPVDAAIEGHASVFRQKDLSVKSRTLHWKSPIHSAVLVTTGRMSISNEEGDHTILNQEDFVYIPKDTPISLEMLDPDTEFFTLSYTALQEDFSNSRIREPPSLIQTQRSCLDALSSAIARAPFNIHIHCNDLALKIFDWAKLDEGLPASPNYYVLHAGNGPRWAFVGLVSRPFIRAAESGNKFSMSFLEWTSSYGAELPLFGRYVSFTNVHHCFYVTEGVLKLKFKGQDDWLVAQEGQVLHAPPRSFFTLDFGSDRTRVGMFSNGTGADELILRGGYRCDGMRLKPRKWDGWDEVRLKSACAEVGAQIE